MGVPGFAGRALRASRPEPARLRQRLRRGKASRPSGNDPSRTDMAALRAHRLKFERAQEVLHAFSKYDQSAVENSFSP
jgi:hypothetical protein